MKKRQTQVLYKFLIIYLLTGLLNTLNNQLLATTYVDSMKVEIKKNPDQRAHINFLIARNFHKQTYGYSANQDSVLHYLKLSITEAEEKNIDTVLARCYTYQAKVLSRAGLYAQANEALKKAKILFRSLGDSLGVSKMDYMTAYNYLDLSMHDIGITYLEKAIRQSENSTDTAFVGGMYLAMGNFHTAMRQFKESRPYTRKAIAILSSINKQVELGGAYHNLARSYAFSEIYDSSYYYYQKSIDIWSDIGYKRGEGILYNNLSEFFTKQEKYDRAIDYLLKAENLLLETGDKKRLRSTYLKIADNYLLQNKTEKARIYIQKAEEQGADLQQFSFLHELDRLKAKMYEQFGNYKLAYEHQVEFLKRADTLMEQEADQRVLEADRRLDFLRKSKEMEVEAMTVKTLEQEKQILEAKQNLYLLLLGSVLLLSILLFINVNKRKKYEANLHEVKLSKSEELNIQLKKELEYREKKLSSYALQLVDKNQKLDEIKKNIETIRSTSSENKLIDELFSLEKSVDKVINTEQSWEEFKLYFEEVHTDFFSRIKTAHPTISSKELRLTALLKLNLSTKEIANLLNLPTKTIEVARYRLRKKLNLKQEENLVEYIMSI